MAAREMRVLCEHGPGAAPALFADASGWIIARSQGEVLPALAALDRARDAGRWVAGFLSYEAGHALEPRLIAGAPAPGATPLLAFGLFDGPGPAADLLARAGAEAGAARLAPLRPRISEAEHKAAFDRVKAYIGAGDCYQINLTFPLDSALTQGSALGLYGALRARQAVGFGGFVDCGTGPVLISRSPELFVRLEAGGRIEAAPMKGTAPRDADPGRDAELAEGLRGSEKDQAENLMIVDLLRNDISRIARVGSVKVPELFAVQSFATVHQMVSRVTGQLLEPASMAGLMTALFPCGSITGAPKIRAMEIIREVEPFARGAYCGSMGWMAPDGSASFNVMIRTLSLFDDGAITLNVGGGVVQDSTAAGEWEEALWKARYLKGLASPV
jgi:para-aminobenzoate synthetase component 1